MTIETSTEYEYHRTAYWEAQDRFRDAAEAEMIRLMPDGIAAVILELNDADPPRLSVFAYRDADGADHDPEEWGDQANDPGRYDALDMIASDLEVHDWHEADGFLFNDSGNPERFLIERER